MKKDPFKIRKSHKLPKLSDSPNKGPYKIKIKEKDLSKMLVRAEKIQLQLDQVRPLYRELDEITSALFNASLASTKMRAFLEKKGVALIDNFADKNTQFKTVAIKRYELRWRLK